jgi:hypothetical protein
MLILAKYKRMSYFLKFVDIFIFNYDFNKMTPSKPNVILSKKKENKSVSFDATMTM